MNLFGKNNFVRQNEVELKGDSRLKNQKPQELIALGVSKIGFSNRQQMSVHGPQLT
jgi:hypothetical protein